MRSGIQGQAAVFRERVRRRRFAGLPAPAVLGRGRRSHGLSRTAWSAVRCDTSLWEKWVMDGDGAVCGLCFFAGTCVNHKKEEVS